jgi:hypothetical protein
VIVVRFDALFKPLPKHHRNTTIPHDSARQGAVRTVQRDWLRARAALRRELSATT